MEHRLALGVDRGVRMGYDGHPHGEMEGASLKEKASKMPSMGGGIGLPFIAVEEPSKKNIKTSEGSSIRKPLATNKKIMKRKYIYPGIILLVACLFIMAEQCTG